MVKAEIIIYGETKEDIIVGLKQIIAEIEGGKLYHGTSDEEAGLYFELTTTDKNRSDGK